MGLRHRRRRIGRVRPRQPPVARTRAPRVLVLEAGRPDWRFDAVHPHAGGADVPDRQPLLRLAVRVGARAVHERPPDLPRPRQGPRRQSAASTARSSSAATRSTTSAGRPIPGMETWDYAHCLPYFKKMEDCLAAAPDDPWRGHDGPLVLERGPATNPLFRAFFAAAEEAGYHADRRTSTATARRGSRRSIGTSTTAGGWSASQAYLQPVRGRRNLTVRTRTFVTRVVFEGGRAVGVEIERQGGGARSGSRPARSSWPAARSTRRSCCMLSGVGRADDLGALGIPVVADLPGVGDAPPGPPRGLHPVQSPPAGLDAAVRDAEVAPAVHRRAVAVPAERARRDEPFRGRRLRPRATTTSPTRT